MAEGSKGRRFQRTGAWHFEGQWCGAFWRTWHIHFGEHVFLRTEGGEMSKWRAMCTELLVENQDLFPRRLYCRDDQTVVRGPLVALGPNLGGPRDLLWKTMTSKKKIQICLDLHHLHVIFSIFFGGGPPTPFLN